MIDRDIATLAMINVSNGSATKEEKYLVDSMDESLFSDIYSELESLVQDTEFSIEDYYKVEGDIPKLDIVKSNGSPKNEVPDLDRSERYKVEQEFEEFIKEFGDEYKSTEDAYKDFIENYCSVTSDRSYSEEYDADAEMECLIVDEFTDFLVNHGNDYSDSEEAYDDYIRNYCNFL